MKNVASRTAALAAVVAVVALSAVAFYQMRPPPIGASPTGTPDATPTVTPTEHLPTVQPSPSPTDLTLVAQSDTFWSPFAGISALWPYEYSGLGDIVEAVDLIVVGTIAEVSLIERPLGPRFSSYVQATVDIEEVLQGEVQTRRDGTVSVTLGRAGEDWETVSQNVPGHRHLFFLFNDAADLAREGDPIEDPEYSTYTYWRPSDQSVLREIDGAVSVVGTEAMIGEYGPERFPLPLNGMSFDELVEQVRLLASEP